MKLTPIQAVLMNGVSVVSVKREDLFWPAPAFSKMRGVEARVKSLQPGTLIGVLDSHHSQAGHAVASIALRNHRVINFWPARKGEYKGPNTIPTRQPQIEAFRLGAVPYALKAGRSCILYHQASKLISDLSGESPPTPFYMFPNGLQLPESIQENAAEVERIRDWIGDHRHIIVSASTGTIAAGILAGLIRIKWDGNFWIHLGYSRSRGAVMKGIIQKLRQVDTFLSDSSLRKLEIVDEGYAYSDKAKPGVTPDFPCSPYYDLKAWRWLCRERSGMAGPILFWNIG